MPRTDVIYKKRSLNNPNKPKDDLLFCIFDILAIAGMIWFSWASPEAQEGIKKEEMQRAENCLAQYVRGGYGGVVGTSVKRQSIYGTKVESTSLLVHIPKEKRD